MTWDFEIPHTSNNELSDIEVGALYKLKTWRPSVVRKSLVDQQALDINSAPEENTTHKIIIPLKRLTFNMNTGDTELKVMMDGNISVLPGWMIGQNGGLLEKLN